MKISKNKNNTKLKILLIIVAATLIFLGGYAAAIKLNIVNNPFLKSNDPMYGKATKDQIEAGKDIEAITDKNSNSGKNPNDVGADHPNKPTDQSGSSKATVSVLLSSANQNDGILQVRIMIGALISEGTCSLTLSRNGAIVTRSAGVQALSNSSTCKGFDIPVTELSSGSWTAEIKFENSNLLGTTTSQVKVL